MSFFENIYEEINKLGIPPKPLGLSEITKQISNLSSHLGVELNTEESARSKQIVPWLRLGKGEQSVLWYGFPHANEPFGGSTILALLKLLLSTEIGSSLLARYTWILVPCIDPEGALINDPWISAYPNILSYFMHSHRGIPKDQVEWAFPLKTEAYSFGNVLPETQLLMGLFHEFNPSFVHSIHNSLFNGMFAYTSRYWAEMGDWFQSLVGKWLRTKAIGEKEVGVCETFAPGIYSTYGMEDVLGDDSEKVDLGKLSIGDSAMGYFKRHFGGTFLLSEIPVLHDPLFPDKENYDLPFSESLYSQYWRERFCLIAEDLRVLWEFVPVEARNDRVGRSFSFFIDQLLRAIAEEEEHGSDEKRMSMIDFRFSQYYNSRLLLASYAGIKEVLKDSTDPSVIKELTQLDRKMQRLIREFYVSIAGLTFESTSAIVKTQLALGLGFQKIATKNQES